MDNYYTVSDKSKAAELKIKGSRFITHIFHVENKNQVQSKYQSICTEYHDARHNCFAYRILEEEYRFSDDGEPSGTAGKPIFQVIKTRDLYQVLIVVTRYFGGIKLGTGGLARAYSEASKEGLNNVHIISEMQYTETNIQIGYDQFKSVSFLINKYDGKTDQINYGGKVTLAIKIPRSKFSNFQQEINHIIR
jgi:uncharacterized YigZ family protein